MEIPFKRKPIQRRDEAIRAARNISSKDKLDVIGARLGINRAGVIMTKLNMKLTVIEITLNH
jgi:hypothetical protein